MKFNIDLDLFRGPLDLLTYLVRKNEVEITDIPIALITEQFLDHLAVLEQLDVNEVGDFIALASWLVEIKSRMVLPRADEVQEEIDDPREELVQRLLEYKNFKDAASILDDRSRRWLEHHPREADDLPPRLRDLAKEPIREVELWDLVSAFGRIIRETRVTQASNIVYDETPIHTYMQNLHQKLRSTGKLSFSEMFEPGMHKSSMIGVFLAILELVRHYKVHAEQSDLFGEIWMLANKNELKDIDFANLDDALIDDYAHGKNRLASLDDEETNSK